MLVFVNIRATPMRILIIEDDDKIGRLLKVGLESGGYAADWVSGGEAGQRRIDLHYKDYDMIILDLMLPQKSGIEICKSARAAGIDTPILMLTAKTFTEDKIIGLDAGADDYITKPFELKELFARIRALLRRPKPSLPAELKVGGIILNPSKRKVFIDGEEIKVTLKEFSLLEYFMRHPGEVLKREDIQSNVWDFYFDSFSNVVDVHINSLRKKINKNRGEDIIETVRGVGYRIKNQD